jgi:geranylgeranylglycerol-phosphate geranylgeranyltransferase
MARITAESSSLHARSGITVYLRALRWRSWIGWLFFFGLGSTLFVIPPYNVLPLSISFSLVTGAIFVLNQYFDRKSDKTNPQKRHLPVAAGKLSPKQSSVLFVSLFAVGLLVTAVVDYTLLFLFVTYIGVGIAYSAPPIHFKKRPIIDLFAVGIGAGILPFLIGLQASHQLTIDSSLPLIWRRYQEMLLCIIPLFFFQIATHIFQAIGDYEADRGEKITTFVVRYGKERSAKIGVLFSSLSLILPIIYGVLNLAVANEFVYWYLLLLLFFLPFVIYLMKLSVNPTIKNIDKLMRVSRRLTPILLLVLYSCVLVLRVYLK